MANGRTYFTSQAQAEQFLTKYGFTQLAQPVGRFNWVNNNTVQYAEIRFNSQGYFVEYF